MRSPYTFEKLFNASMTLLVGNPAGGRASIATCSLTAATLGAGAEFGDLV